MACQYDTWVCPWKENRDPGWIWRKTAEHQLKVESWMRMVSVAGNMVCFFEKCTCVSRPRIDLCDSNFPMQKLSDFPEIVFEKKRVRKMRYNLEWRAVPSESQAGCKNFSEAPRSKILNPYSFSQHNSIAQVYVWAGTWVLWHSKNETLLNNISCNLIERCLVWQKSKCVLIKLNTYLAVLFR